MSRIILYASLCLQSVPVLHREITLPALIILGKITAFKVLKFSFLIFSFPTLHLALMEMTLSLVNVSAILLKKIYQQFFPPISYFLFSKIVVSIHHNSIVIILLILAQIPNCTVSYCKNGRVRPVSFRIYGLGVVGSDGLDHLRCLGPKK